MCMQCKHRVGGVASSSLRAFKATEPGNRAGGSVRVLRRSFPELLWPVQADLRSCWGCGGGRAKPHGKCSQRVSVSGGLADGEDERGQLHGVLHAWRHAAEGEGVHHEGVQIWSQPRPDLHGRVGSGPGRPPGVPHHQLRPAQQQRALHPQDWPVRALRQEGRGHQLCEER